MTQEMIPWGGFHHIALSTPDLEATIQFYRDVLGMELLFVGEAGEMHGRSCGFSPGSGILHFFEYLDAQIFSPPDLNKMYWLPGALHHIAIAIPDENAALALRDILQQHDVPMTEIMDQGDVRNMVFSDNNGILLEATWPKS
jgi:catechol 2,3-dioxygenase-like lactoylglutathione lyase family enzyme